jgi:hypothetical protein
MKSVRERLALSPLEVSVCPSGYQWRWAEVPSHPSYALQVLASGGPETGGPRTEFRKLILPCDFTLTAHSRRQLGPREAGLHREFAALSASEEAIADFAARFGLLRGRQPADVTAVAPIPSLWLADSWEDWRGEIEAARRAIELWDSSDRGRHASQSVLDQLVALMDSRLGCELRPVRRPDQRGLMPQIAPSTLGGAIWLQILREASGWIEVIRCRNCGRWFQFDPANVRRDPFLCSPACRTATHRQRKAEALKLGASGLAPATIARRVGTTEERVRQWITQPPPVPEAGGRRGRKRGKGK